jgi:hypothetical protein
MNKRFSKKVLSIFDIITMAGCARPGCYELGLSRYSICLREPYCSADCQKGDWKSHKLICETLKKLSHQDCQQLCKETDEELKVIGSK